MSNVFVVNAVEEVAIDKQPRLAYKNVSSSPTVTITASHDQANVAYLHDQMTTLKWTPGALAPTLQYDGNFIDIDYIGFAGANFGDTGCQITVRDQDSNIIGQASGLRDNQPVLMAFAKATYTRISIQFVCTKDTLQVGEIAFGESLEFPRNVAVGYSPARWNSNDLINLGVTESNQFAGSVVRARGSTESFSIRYVDVSFAENEYKDFVDNAKGLAVWFLWDKDNQSHTVYGNWKASVPSFESAYLTSISLEIDGVA